MILVQKQTHRSVEQNEDPRDKSMLKWSIVLWQGGKSTEWSKIHFPWMVLGKVDSSMQKNQSKLSHIIYKNKHKME